MHPYRKAPAKAFWSKAVAGGIDPEALLGNISPLVRKGERVVSAGSCFAANMVPYLEKQGLKYLRTESPPAMLSHWPEALGYANFSAAYGNIYTPRQLLQLLRRSLGRFRPYEDRWYGNQTVIDPYRPGLIYQARTDVEFDALTAQHLESVRQAFTNADVLVVTLGLTEAWASKKDGSIFPACPGTVAGAFNAELHEFVNFSVSDIAGDLLAFVDELRAVNPTVRLVLTVSPVPLVATATMEHVLVASTYSKSVLRVAAQEVAAARSDVAYFPAYEIVTGPQAPDAFYGPDRRNVTQIAVDTVMSMFLSACETNLTVAAINAPNPKVDPAQLLSRAVEQECEELMAER